GELSVLDAIAERLRMFNTHTQSEAFGLDRKAEPVGQDKNISRRVARGQHNGGCFKALFVSADEVLIGNPAHAPHGTSPLRQDISVTGAKSEFDTTFH